MSVKALLRCWLGVLLMVLWTGSSTGQSAPPGVAVTAEEGLVPAGVDAIRWRRIVGLLQANSLPAASVQDCLAPVQEAIRQGLPPDPVLARIEEGAAKAVDGSALRDAVRNRLANLQSAAAMLRQAGYGARTPSHDQLMRAVTLALESGLSTDTLKAVLTRAQGGQAERVRSIVEAGETMRLSGMDEPAVGQMMVDFAERNMRRTEVIRASRFAVQQHRANVEGTRIRQQLWDGTGSGGRWGGGGSTPDAGGPGGSASRGSGPTESGGPAGAGGSAPSPGNTPAGGGGGDSRSSGGGSAADPGVQSGSGGTASSLGNARPAANGGTGGASGSTGQGAKAPSDAGAQGTTPNRGR